MLFFKVKLDLILLTEFNWYNTQFASMKILLRMIDFSYLANQYYLSRSQLEFLDLLRGFQLASLSQIIIIQGEALFGIILYILGYMEM
jgi:hypothetical protein